MRTSQSRRIARLLCQAALGLALLVHLSPARADFNFYERKCEELAEHGCRAALVAGPNCRVTARGACKEFERIDDCEWKAVFFGAPIWTCRAVNGACIAYHEICQEYEQVCTAGYKEVCENVLRPYAAIKDELAWVVYQQYMSSVGAESKGPLHGSIVSEFQPYYSVDLGSVAVSVGAAAGGEGITDCNHIHLPSSELVRTLQDGDDIIEESDLRWILHELRHVNQCQQIGGRKKYAILWFSQFEITLKLRLDETIRDAISLMSGKGTQYVHDAMPMEHEAEEFAQRILPAVRNSTRQGN